MNSFQRLAVNIIKRRGRDPRITALTLKARDYNLNTIDKIPTNKCLISKRTTPITNIFLTHFDNSLPGLNRPNKIYFNSSCFSCQGFYKQDYLVLHQVLRTKQDNQDGEHTT
jgi:hypothetical protein